MRPALIVLALLLAGCTQAPTEEARERTPDGVTGDETVLLNSSFFLPPFGAHAPMRVEARILVLEGGPIDVWLAPRATCEKYGQRSFDPPFAALNVTSAVLNASFDAGDHCLVLDNADFAMGEARASGDVRVRWQLSIWVE